MYPVYLWHIFVIPTYASRMICPTKPIITGFGRSAISLKSAGLSAKPKSNISSVSIGSTIKMVFIPLESMIVYLIVF